MNKFFIWCSGADVATVLKCESPERNKYFNVGMVVFFVALLAALSATYFVSYAFDKSTDPSITPGYALVGLLWGFVIISLDRSIVATINKEDPIKKQLIRAAPRFVIAIFIGLVISTPLEMKIFSKEINNKLKEIIFNEIGSGSKDQLTARKEILSAKERELSTLDNEKNINYRIFRDEIKGGTTGQLGYGKKAREYEGNYNKSFEQYNAKKLEVDSARADLRQLQFGLGTVESISDEQIAQRAGVEKRVIALYSLNSFHWVITALFILFEILPMIVKLLGAKGNYEKFSRDQRELYQQTIVREFELQQNRRDELRQAQWEQEDKQRTSKETIEFKLKEEILLQLAQVQKDIVTERIIDFKKKSLEELYFVQREINANGVASEQLANQPSTPNGKNEKRTEYTIEGITVNPDSDFITDPLLEEIIWKGDYETVPSVLAFLSGGKQKVKPLFIKKGVKVIEGASWYYKDRALGKLIVSIKGNNTNFDYQINGRELSLRSKKIKAVLTRIEG